jgi:hypothetical protein
VALKPDDINIGGIVVHNHSMVEQLPVHQHTWLVLFSPTQADQLPMHNGCNNHIEQRGPEAQHQMGPIYKLSKYGNGVLKTYNDERI